VKQILVLAIVALVVPSIALAAKPPTPGQSQTPHVNSQATHGQSQTSHGKAAPKVMYVLRGILTAYTPATDTARGSVTIEIRAANHHGAALKQQPPLSLTFPVSTKTKIRLPQAGFSAGDKVIVKLRAPKKIAVADLTSTLQALDAFQVIDQGPPTTG
jgi:hypothetical protein